MKRIWQSVFLVSSIIIISGCLSTASSTLDSSDNEFKPSVNNFEKRSWISYESLHIFQDEDFVYFSISYIANTDGVFSIFNPPNGSSCMVKGNLSYGKGEIFERVEKSNLKGIEGITMLFFPGDFSNDSESTGLFVKSDELKLNQIPLVDPERYTFRDVSQSRVETEDAIHTDAETINTGFKNNLQIRITPTDDVINHIDDPSVHGMWYFKDIVDSIELFDPELKSHKFGNAWKYTSFQDDGVLLSRFNSSSGMVDYWTKGKIIFAENDGTYEIYGYQTKVVDDNIYLFAEWKDNQTDAISYYVFERRD